MTAESFLEVLCGNENLADLNVSGICIYDNARPHIRVSDLGDPGNFIVRRIPKYMAKNAISGRKQAIKRSLASRKDEFISPTGEILNGRTL